MNPRPHQPSAEVPELVVLDVGGTIIEDRGDVPVAFEEALSAAGLEADASQVAAWRGASKRAVITELVAGQRPHLERDEREALVWHTYARFSATLSARLRDTGARAIPNVQHSVDRLKAAGIRVALNSGFDRSILDVILNAIEWPDHAFDAIVCADDVAAGRPAPFMIFRSMERTGVTDVGRVAVVGDTRLDLEAGLNAGVAYRIGVLTGAHDRATLERAPYTHIVTSVAAVPDLWLTSSLEAATI